jgi:enterochelin esterase family protein
VNGLPKNARQVKVDSFLQATTIFPVTEDTLAHFVFTGNVPSVSAAGDFNGWNPANGAMTLIQGTDFWYRTYVFDSAARLEYKFVHSTGQWILDPLNPNRISGGFGDNSVLMMKDYMPPPEIEYYPQIPHGTLESRAFTSAILNNTRTVKIYLPPGYADSSDDYPFILVHDGLDYVSRAQMNSVLDYLLWQTQTGPFIAVFVPPVDRNPEYQNEKQSDFTNAMIEELIPQLETEYRIKRAPEHRAVMGSSSGGNISLWLGMNHPEQFGLVAAFSPYIESDIQTAFNDSNRLPLKIYINHGTYDHISLIQWSVNHFLPILQAKGYDYRYEEYPEGHNYGFWRAHIDDALHFLFPGSSEVQEGHRQPENRLMQNFPNPFNDSTRIHFALQEPDAVHSAIYNIRGERVRTLLDGWYGAGKYRAIWDGRDSMGNGLPSGIYFLHFSSGRGGAESKRLVLIR